ncbi:MAG: signal recognition particle protein [Actinomycetota bacterium]
MFETLSERLETAFTRLRGKGKLTEADVEEGLKEIRLALLDADVAVPVARTFLDRVREQAVGEGVLKSITPGQQLVKIVNDQLVHLLGREHRPLKIADKPPTIILLVGLQGSGKTTAAAKLATILKGRGIKPLLAACDLQRPAAVDQLKQLGSQIGVDVEAPSADELPGGDPVEVARRALDRVRDGDYAALIVDSAGRLHVDEELMQQARSIKNAVQPTETLLVLDAMTGQDAVHAAAAFSDALEPTGSILTKLDGDARGGAALSLVETTGVPILFASVGERTEDLEPFYPDRMASRILGMGDILTLVEKAEAQLEDEEAAKLEKKMLEATFDLEDFMQQLRMIKKMGPIQNVLGMLPKIPGVGKIPDEAIDEGALVRTEAIIQSMTPLERRKPTVINASRRSRIANGSGTKPQDVSQLIKQFDMMRKMMKQQMGTLAGRVMQRSSKKARKNLPKMKGF